MAVKYPAIESNTKIIHIVKIHSKEETPVITEILLISERHKQRKEDLLQEPREPKLNLQKEISTETKTAKLQAYIGGSSAL